MASVVFYFELHQPFRLRRYSVFDTDPFYFDNAANERILLKVAEKCYRPATAKLLDLVQRHDRRFRVTFSVSGTALQQLEQWAPDVLDTLRRLVDTGLLPSDGGVRPLIEWLGSGVWPARIYRTSIEAMLRLEQPEAAQEIVALAQRHFPKSPWLAKLDKDAGLQRMAKASAIAPEAANAAAQPMAERAFAQRLADLLAARAWDEAARHVQQVLGLRPPPAWLGRQEPSLRLAQVRIAIDRVIDGRTFKRRRLLRHMRDAPGFREIDDAAVRMQLIAQHRKQRGLAAAIGADQADFLAGVDGQVSCIEQHLRAAHQRQRLQTDHGNDLKNQSWSALSRKTCSSPALVDSQVSS